jgi:D-glycero-alpha-D-manno-heptose 1-phosphate guanylyltransferase
MALLGGRPFLAYLLDQLATQGVREVVLCTGYLGEQVQAYFGDHYQGIALTYSREARPLGTAGALRQALPHLTDDTLLVLNGDSYCDCDFGAVLHWHHHKRALATVVLAKVDNGARFGDVQTASDGRIEAFREKTGALNASWINSGVYWLERSLLAALRPDQILSLERDVFGSWRGPGLYGYRQSGRFLDIGVPEDYARAERFLADLALPLPALAI